MKSTFPRAPAHVSTARHLNNSRAYPSATVSTLSSGLTDPTSPNSSAVRRTYSARPNTALRRDTLRLVSRRAEPRTRRVAVGTFAPHTSPVLHGPLGRDVLYRKERRSPWSA